MFTDWALYRMTLRKVEHSNLTVPDGKGLCQLACQEEWKKCKEEEE
jgi:hypothetical protein